jgi:glutamyl-tRNA reductase
MLGCSHHDTVLEVREQVAFSPEQVREALERLKLQYPDCELV